MRQFLFLLLAALAVGSMPALAWDPVKIDMDQIFKQLSPTTEVRAI